jgi:hypothetical protein
MFTTRHDFLGPQPWFFGHFGRVPPACTFELFVMSSTPRHPAYLQYRINRKASTTPSNHPENDDPEEQDGTIEKPILAINYKNKCLGGAYWKSDENTLIILSDIQCANVIDMIDLGTSRPDSQ